MIFLFAEGVLSAEGITTESGPEPLLLEMLEQNGTSRSAAPMRAPIDFAAEKNSTKVVMLGSGSPIPIIERFGPGVAGRIGSKDTRGNQHTCHSGNSK